jgi:hypothetical protein
VDLHRAFGLAGQLVRLDVRDHPVDGVDLRAERAAVDQEGQAEVPRTGAVAGGVGGGLPLEVRRVAVVTVGDDRRPVVQVGGDRRQLGGVGQRP